MFLFISLLTLFSEEIMSSVEFGDSEAMRDNPIGFSDTL